MIGIRAASHRLSDQEVAKLLFVDYRGEISSRARSQLAQALRPGDLVIANDAATLPASLMGVHLPSRRPIELRLAGRDTLALDRIGAFTAIVFGEGDFRTRTEDRPDPPDLVQGDQLAFGPLRGVVAQRLNHPRLIRLVLEGPAPQIWAGLARYGRPIQYAHVPKPLALWDVWTPLAAAPVAFEAPSAGFAVDWRTLAAFVERGIDFATITLAAGISSTGDSALDALLPLDEAYSISPSTAASLERARAERRRVVAIGTSVVRALEHSASLPATRIIPGERIATQRIGEATRLNIVDALLTGVHQPGESHFELLRAFAKAPTLARAQQTLAAGDYRSHEFGDSMLIERASTL